LPLLIQSLSLCRGIDIPVPVVNIPASKHKFTFVFVFESFFEATAARGKVFETSIRSVTGTGANVDIALLLFERIDTPVPTVTTLSSALRFTSVFENAFLFETAAALGIGPATSAANVTGVGAAVEVGIILLLYEGIGTPIPDVNTVASEFASAFIFKFAFVFESAF